ncbi:protein of unknown function [Pararobbsia alpina]|uniref:DUF6723 family protein n=1 Tax=Pararobbsia alpina TaxID=621374 RepID=UPI0039A72B6C
MASQSVSDPIVLTRDDFVVVSGYSYASSGQYFGVLKVKRRTDGRQLFPYEGAPQIGPFSSGYEARTAAEQYGQAIVDMDLATPET